MNKLTKMVMQKIAEVDATNEGAALDLRLDVSCIIHAALAKKGWSQKTLADRAKMKPPLLTRIMHGDSNCTLESISRIFTALEIKGKIVI